MGDREGEKAKTRWLTSPKRIIAGVVLVGLALLGLTVAGTKPHFIPAFIGRLTGAHKPSPAAPKIPDTGVRSTPHGPLDVKGSGSQETKQFTAGVDWDLEWSYDCSDTKAQGNFIVSVYDAKGRTSTDTPPVVQFGLKGSGVQHYHKAGVYFLGVRSSCTWHALTRPPSSPSPSSTP